MLGISAFRLTIREHFQVMRFERRRTDWEVEEEEGKQATDE